MTGPLVLLCAGWALTFSGVAPWGDESIGDIPVYAQYAGWFLDGLLPYADVPFEYPPLAALVIAGGGLVGTDLETYRHVFGLLMLGLGAGAVALTGRIAAATGGREREAMYAVAALPLLLGTVPRTHYDLLPVVLLLGALLALVRRRPLAAFVLIGLGTAAKGFPLLAAPVALAWLAGRGEWRAAAAGLAGLAATLGAVAGLALALSPEGAWRSVEYHLERPVQIESAPATALNAIEVLGGEAPRQVASHHSDGLLHPLSGAASGGFLGLFALALLVCVVGAYRSHDLRAPVLAALCATAAFAAFGKVLSPQFLVWVLPLAALALAWRLHALAVVTSAAAALTLVGFPGLYFDLVAREPGPLAIVALRNVALVAAVALATVWLTRHSAEAGGSRWRARRGPPPPARRSATDRSRRAPSAAAPGSGSA